MIPWGCEILLPDRLFKKRIREWGRLTVAGRPEGGGSRTGWLRGVGPAKDMWTSTPLGPGEVTLLGRRVFANVTSLNSVTSVLIRERQREIGHRRHRGEAM